MTTFSALKTPKALRVIGWTSGIAIVLYLIALLAFYRFQDKVIFQGKSLPKGFAFKFEQNFEEHFIKTEDGASLNALLFKTSAASKGLILYFHGNADNMERWGQYVVDFTQLDYDVLMMDYRGYGKSTGTPSESNMYKDALIVLAWAKDKIPFTRLVIYGRSLGSAVASNLAMVANPYLLILETPFDELKGTTYAPMEPLLYFFPLRHEFSNKSFLPKSACRKVIIHGTEDWVVPLSSAMKLKPLLKAGDQFVIIEGGGHRNLRDFESFHKTLADVLD